MSEQKARKSHSVKVSYMRSTADFNFARSRGESTCIWCEKELTSRRTNRFAMLFRAALRLDSLRCSIIVANHASTSADRARNRQSRFRVHSCSRNINIFYVNRVSIPRMAHDKSGLASHLAFGLAVGSSVSIYYRIKCIKCLFHIIAYIYLTQMHLRTYIHCPISIRW